MGTQTGTSANDTLTGGGGDDVAFGGAGNDTVYGGDGDDLSYGGTGNDALYGGNGNDANAGEKGDDAMYGGAGRDTLVGGQGHDTMYGGSDNDTMPGDGQWLNLAEYASGSGGKATNLTLTNSADGPIDLYQINGSGKSVYVATIQPGQTLVQSTTTTTNWILCDPDGYYLEPITGASNQTVNYGPDLSDTMYGGERRRSPPRPRPRGPSISARLAPSANRSPRSASSIWRPSSGSSGKRSTGSFSDPPHSRSAWPALSGSLDYAVSLDGLPLSLWRSRAEPGP